MTTIVDRPETEDIIEAHECGLTDTQQRLLLQALDPDRVSRREGQSYVEAWDDRRHLTRIFGFTGWSEQCIKNERVDVDKHPRTEKRGPKQGQPIPGTVCYTVTCEYTVRLVVKCRCGRVLTAHDGTAAGDGINLPTLAAADDFAVKTAASQALKRACINLGDQFGLSLYNDGSTEPVVIGTAFTMDARSLAAADSRVIGGEGEPDRDESAVVEWVREFGQRISQASAEEIRGPLWTQLKAKDGPGGLSPTEVTVLADLMKDRIAELEAVGKPPARLRDVPLPADGIPHDAEDGKIDNMPTDGSENR